MMLGHDAGEVCGASRPKPFGANPRVIGVDPVPTGEGGPRSLQGLECPRRDGLQEDGQASVDHREVRTCFAQVVQQGRLLQQPARLTLETGHGFEHVEAVTLVIDRQLEE